VEELHGVALACGVDLRVPREDDVLAWKTSSVVSSAIKNQGIVVQGWRRELDVLVPRDQGAALDSVMLNERVPLSIPHWGSLSIGGVELDVGNVWLDMPDALLVARTRIEQDGEEMEQLKFVGELHSYRFERWLKTDAADVDADAPSPGSAGASVRDNDD